MGILEFFAAYLSIGLATALGLSLLWSIFDPGGAKDDELAAMAGAFWPVSITILAAGTMFTIVKELIASVRRFGTYLKNKWGS
jgi:hypothetical protein